MQLLPPKEFTSSSSSSSGDTVATTIKKALSGSSSRSDHRISSNSSSDSVKYTAVHYPKMLLPDKEEYRYPSPLTTMWKVRHCFLYMCGGILFLVGSFSYYPTVSTYEIGGWSYTIGSICFVIADFFEWWTNNRIGCFYSTAYEESFEKYILPRMFDNKDTFRGRLQRATLGINFFLSVIGSALYAIGSIMFIPQTDFMVTGTRVFVLGSVVIILNQSWKVWRMGYNCEEPVTGACWSAKNYTNDVPAVIIDTAAGVGGLFFLVGSIYFLPRFDKNTFITHEAAALFVTGSVFFTISGLAMCVRYFITSSQPAACNTLSTTNKEERAQLENVVTEELLC